MRIPRIYHPENLQSGIRVELEPKAATHITRVLRMKEGAELVLFNGDGHNYQAILVGIGRNQAIVEIGSAHAVDRESPVNITLAQGISRGERMDYTIQKAVELGITHIIPLTTERSMSMDEKRREKKMSHWHGVITSACEQCGRTRIPELHPIQELRTWLSLRDRESLCLTLDPLSDIALSQIQYRQNGISLLIGPEGGLSPEEIEITRNQGFQGVRLGPRILRTETAAIAALGAIQALWGDFG